jgi:hypothetical protein
MRPIKFKESNTVFAENQPPYCPLPCLRFKDDVQGQILCCWELSFRERLAIFFGGKIWHSILTFNSPLQPQKLWASKPTINFKEADHHEG